MSPLRTPTRNLGSTGRKSTEMILQGSQEFIIKSRDDMKTIK